VRIIVTGGAGFIGSHIVDAYLGAGHDVLVLDSLWEHGGGRRVNVPERANFVHMDIRDQSVMRIFQEFKPEIVSHHAAQHSVAISSRDPKLDADVNVMGMLNVLDASVKTGVKKVIFASSGATYGTPDRLPMSELTPQRPESPYGITKMVTEHYLRFYKNERGLDFTALRYGNVYGPRQDPHGEAGVVAIFCGRMLEGKPCTIYGDGKQTRDYVFVADVARANIAAANGNANGAINIGTGLETSVNELYHTLGTVGDVTRAPEYGPARPGEQSRSVISPARAGELLNWRPQVELANGLDQTFTYFKEHKERG
jgi:UDP-glucose 4-epimerase